LETRPSCNQPPDGQANDGTNCAHEKRVCTISHILEPSKHPKMRIVF
jgi:hypothetical protein